MIANQRKETARHEYFFTLSHWETFVGVRKSIARGGLFDWQTKEVNEET